MPAPTAPVQRTIGQLAEMIAQRLFSQKDKSLYLELKPLLQQIVDQYAQDQEVIEQLAARPTTVLYLRAVPGEDPNSLN